MAKACVGLGLAALAFGCGDQKGSQGVAGEVDRAAGVVREEAAELDEAARQGGAAEARDAGEAAARDAARDLEDRGALGAAEEAADAAKADLEASARTAREAYEAGRAKGEDALGAAGNAYDAVDDSADEDAPDDAPTR